MTRDQFILGIGRLGRVEVLPMPNGQVFAILEPQAVPGTGRSSSVAFLVPDQLAGRPQVYVDADLRTRSGGVPNNWTTTVYGTRVFGTWSFNCPWDPSSDTPEALALAALGQWNR